MKKWNKRRKAGLCRVLVSLLVVVGIAGMLPMDSVQALKRKSVMRLETKAEQESEESGINELVPKQTEEKETQEQTAVKTETAETETAETETVATETVKTEAEETAEDASDTEAEKENTELNVGKAQWSSVVGEGISVKIEDDIEKNLIYQNDRYVKKITHTIILTRDNEIMSAMEQMSKDANIYKDISYIIYQKTSEGEIRLNEGSLEIPNQNDIYSTNEIEITYAQAGDYCIRVKGIRRREEADGEEVIKEVEFACHDFSVEKDTPMLNLKKSTVILNYGDSFYIDDCVETNSLYPFLKEYEIKEESEDKILEIGKKDGKDYVKAVGVNGAEGGETAVTIRQKETPLMEASDTKTLKVHVKPMELDLKVQLEEEAVYMYDTLAAKVTVQKDGENVTGELFEQDSNLSIEFMITSDTSSCKVSSKALECEKDSAYTFCIPVKREYFGQFSKGAKYSIAAALTYDNEQMYFPYKVDTVIKDVELLGRRAVIKLSADCDGIYDYRTYFGTQPSLWVQIEDTTVLPEDTDGNTGAETGQKALLAEAVELAYNISSANNDVVSVDKSEAYTAADDRIPLRINGIGTTILTVTVDGSSVYTVEDSKIEVTVENSPLYDEDFVIHMENADMSEVQSFLGDGKQTGFEKWQEYLSARDGWINGSVRISLTEAGLKYYHLLSLTENGIHSKEGKRLVIQGDKKITEYEFWAENGDTKAYTKGAKDIKNGKRSFQMGIDATAPVLESFVPSDDYYALTSTEKKRYFPKSFVLKGSFTDATSGIAAIEYTTNMKAEGGAEWILLEQEDTPKNSRDFSLELNNGSYNAIAVRAVDAAGNVSEPACLKNENGEFIRIIVDDTPPDIDMSVMSREEGDTWHVYSAEGENWTNKEIRFRISEKAGSSDVSDAGEASFTPIDGAYAELYRVEYVYQSIAAALRGDSIGEDAWQELAVDEHGIAEFSIGKDSENPVNQNGYYYFRGVSETGVKSKTDTKVRVLLWQQMAPKKAVEQSGADPEKCHNEWYNKESGTPVIDFAYPEYDTGVISDEYAAPITIHFNLSVKNEKDAEVSLADDKTATIRAYTPSDMTADKTFTGFPLVRDDLSEMQAALSDDGIYMLEYWTTDAAGNQSETESFLYKVDCHEPTQLTLRLGSEEQPLRNENTLLYEKFYQNSVSGEAAAEYGISGKDSIKLLKAKRIGEWETISPAENAEQFTIEPNLRCLLYVKAVDGAGNMTEGWTRGIVVDNEAPAGDNTPKMIIEPEGANRHGFFNKDVKVKISIKDAPNDGNSAGLKLVTGFVGTNDVDTISNKELFSGMEDSISEQLIAETEGFSIMETIDAKANEGNHAYITINAVDRSENMSTDTQELKIDVTKPEIEITFDNESAVNGRYYNTDRRAKINIHELNFDASLVEIKVKRNGEDFTPSISDWQSDKNDHYAYIDFSADGDYTLTVACKDLADNEAEEESTELFTIDKTMPRVEIALENGNVQNEYFNETQMAVITVTEHNFHADDFQLHMQPVGKIGSWEHKNDTHVIKVELSSEGEYELSCDYKDLAGNGITEEDKSKLPFALVIDKTSPVIAISGVEDNSANAGEVIPNIIIQDINMEPLDAAITLTTGRGAVIDISADITTAPAEGGLLYTLNGLDAKSDDIYYLAVNAADKAGNTSELTYRFSLNRRGSAYDLTDLTKLVDSYYNSYNNLDDIKIIEMNVDKVEEFALYLSHNTDIIYGQTGSRPYRQDENKLPEAALYGVEVSGSEDTGYVYTYTLYRENFALEGTYRLGIYSKDKAGNEVNNLLKQNGEEIQFVIDNTMPRVVIDGVESNEIYDVDSKEVHIVADDNFKLAEAELMLVNKDNEVLESWNYFDFVEKEGDTAAITIGEHKEEVSLLYRAVDMAGNEIRTLQGEKQAKADFLITTDKFVQLVNKPTKSPIGRVIIIVLVIFVMGVLLILASFKRVFLKKRK